jgi:hypothetical protein
LDRKLEAKEIRSELKGICGKLSVGRKKYFWNNQPSSHPKICRGRIMVLGFNLGLASEGD